MKYIAHEYVKTMYIVQYPQGHCSKRQAKINKPENQDEDALGKIEQQQDFVILSLTLRVLDND